MLVLDNLYIVDNTCRDCFLQKILHCDKFPACGVQLMQNRVSLIHNLLDWINPVIRKVDLLHFLPNLYKFSHRYLAVLAFDFQMRACLIKMLLQNDFMLFAKLFLQLIENFFREHLDQRNYIKEIFVWIAIFKILNSFVNVFLNAGKNDLGPVSDNDWLFFVWSENKLFDLTYDAYLFYWFFFNQFGNTSVFIWNLIIWEWDSIF